MERVISGTSNAIGSVASATGSAVNSIGERVTSYETSTVLKLLKFLNLLDGIGLVVTGVLNWIEIPTCSSSACLPTAIISFHLVLFGVLLFGYEARMGSNYDKMLRRQFGFLYGQWGRFFFLLFLASLCFGIIYTSLPFWWVQALVGVYTLANALLNCFVIRKHPGFQRGTPEESQGIEANNARGGQDLGDDRPPPVASSSAYGGSGLYSGGAGSGLYGQTSASNSGGSGNPFAVTNV